MGQRAEGRNREMVDRFYKVYSGTKGSDRAMLFDVLANEVRWRSLGSGRDATFTEGQQGRSEIKAYFDALYADWELVRYDVEDLVASDDKVVAICDVAFRNRHSGKLLESPKVDVWTFNPDGRLIEFHEFYDTLKVAQANVAADR